MRVLISRNLTIWNVREILLPKLCSRSKNCNLDKIISVKLLFIFEKIVREIHYLFSRYRILKFIRINSSLTIIIKECPSIYKNLIDDGKVFENKKERVTVVLRSWHSFGQFFCLRESVTTSTSSCRTSSWEEARHISDTETAVCPHGAASWWTARIAIVSSPNAILELADCSHRIIPEFTPGMSLATIGWSKTARQWAIELYSPLVNETVTRYTLRTRSSNTIEVNECLGKLPTCLMSIKLTYVFREHSFSIKETFYKNQKKTWTRERNECEWNGVNFPTKICMLFKGVGSV